jgi:hypothetical protein
MMDLSKPLRSPIEVDTTTGKLRLHDQRGRDLVAFAKLPDEATPLVRFRAYLPSIASHFEPAGQDAGARINDAIAAKLSDDDLERIAGEYLKMVPADAGTTPRDASESAVACLDCLLRAKYAKQKAELQRISDDFKKKYGSVVSAAMAALDKQTASMRDLVGDFDRDQRLAGLAPNVEQVAASKVADQLASGPRFGDNHAHAALEAMDESAAKRERERAEAFKTAKSIEEMTAQTARLMETLADAASKFILQFGDIAAKSDAATRRSIRIAVWSVVITALLAGLVAFISAKSHFQDQRANELAEKWQESVIQTLKENAASEQERNRLLTEKLLELNTRQNAIEPPAVAREQPTAPATTAKKPARGRHSKKRAAPT